MHAMELEKYHGVFKKVPVIKKLMLMHF